MLDRVPWPDDDEDDESIVPPEAELPDEE